MIIKRKTLIYFYVAIIVLLMILPINSPESKINHTFILKLRADYWIHAFLFFPWQLLEFDNKFIRKRAYWFLAGICFACLVEGLQYILPYRGFNINDAVANISGVSGGAALSLIFKRQNGCE